MWMYHESSLRRPNVYRCSLACDKKLVMLHSLQINLLLAHTIAIIIGAVTGRTQAEKDGVWIAKIMVTVCRVQVHPIPLSGAFGCALPALSDMAKLALPPCVFLTLPRQIIPIVGIAFPPFGFHKDSLVGKYHRRYNACSGTSAVGKCSVLGLANYRTECLLNNTKRGHLP